MGKTLRFTYQRKDVTPYMHAFMMHVPEFIALHGNLVSFSQQGLEKLNDFSTKQFQLASNHRNIESLLQMLEKRREVLLPGMDLDWNLDWNGI